VKVRVGAEPLSSRITMLASVRNWLPWPQPPAATRPLMIVSDIDAFG